MAAGFALQIKVILTEFIGELFDFESAAHSLNSASAWPIASIQYLPTQNTVRSADFRVSRDLARALYRFIEVV